MTVSRKNVLNISRRNSIGQRFNNLAACEKFPLYGWNSYNCSWTHPDGPEGVVSRAKGHVNRFVTEIIGKIGERTGDLNGYYRNAKSIKSLPHYMQADMLHFHIVHENWLSVHDWLSLAANKPVVWTWHDPYMLTGNCIHPYTCKGFETGCQVCPHLDYHFPVKKDRARLNLQEKFDAVKAIDPL